jgi:hypothetical protein
MLKKNGEKIEIFCKYLIINKINDPKSISEILETIYNVF